MLAKKWREHVYLVALFISGLTSLIYQILWIREFSLFFGVHVYSLSTVLAAFMAGLAFGSYLFGVLVDKFPRRASLIFFLIQLALGLFAILFGFFLSLISSLYVFTSQNFELSFTAQNLIRPLLGFLLLIFPASLMGGVIPVASRLFVKDVRQTGSKISLIYYVNNFGAVAGCFLAGFVLVSVFGTEVTFYIASAMNFLTGAAGLVFFSGKKHITGDTGLKPLPGGKTGQNRGDSRPYGKKYPDKLVRIALWVFAIEGFTTLAYQVLWARLMVEFSFEKTIYFTTAIIMSFILGLAFGGYVYHRIEEKITNQFRFLGVIQVSAGVSSLLLFGVFNIVAPEMVNNRVAIDNWWLLAVREYSFIIALLFVPTFFTGMSFPLITKIYTRKISHIGLRVGLAGVLDTVGSIAGSLLAGFIMLPLLGIYYSFIIVVAINLVLALVVFNYDKRAKPKINVISNITIPVVFVAGIFLFPEKKYHQLHNEYYRGEEIIFRKEGVAATVQVNIQATGHYALVINGAKTAFTNNDDLRVHKMLAYLPYLFNTNAQSAYVIGFGMGVTSGTLAALPITSVTVADICPELLTPANIFTAYNKNITVNPKFSFIPEDGRSYLLRTDKKFDIITSNAVHARLNANLFTSEFYRLSAKKLNPGGVVCQWVPTNWMTRDEFKSLIKAFTDVFDYSQLWFVTRGHLILVGSGNPMTVDYRTLENLYRNKEIIADLSYVDLFTPQRFVANLMLAGDDLTGFAEGPYINTDDRPVVEFSRETDLRPDTAVLEELSESRVDFSKEVDFSNYPDTAFIDNILDVIVFENKMIKNYLRDFSRIHQRGVDFIYPDK